jgi:phosphatidylinositol alpha-1,6-mannosyltransferase
MRIAVLATNPLKTYGWGNYAHGLITALAEQGHKVVLITSVDAVSQTDLPVEEYHRVLPSLIHSGRFSSIRILNQQAKVGRIAQNCDLVHVTAEPYVLAVPRNYPLVVSAHGTYVPKTSQRRGTGPLFRLAYKRAFILCGSRYTERQVKAILPNAWTRVITYGVDFDHYHRPIDPAHLPQKIGPTIVSVGQMKPRKGFHIVAKAMRGVREAVGDAQAVFIGDNSETGYVENIKAQLATDGLTDLVHILGRVPEETLLGWYHTADIFALPTMNSDGRFEGFGLVYLEAGAAGLPVIGTYNSGGGEDAIHDGETGLLVPQDDSDATADAIIRLLRDHDLRSRMSAAGIANAQENTWDKVAQRVVETYKLCLQEKNSLIAS